jgi:molybdate transport system ATP-binding protein
VLQARLVSRRGPFTLDVDLAAPARATLVVVGENGSGKTTLLRLLAGLDRPDEGVVRVEDATWFDARGGVETPPERRALGYVPQDLALFPHLSAAENIAFGLRAQRMPPDHVRPRTAAMLERLGIAALAGRRPGALSGGERQRVALGRALVLEPKLLLLDEPFASLDLQTRRGVRGELRRLLAGLPCITVFVTHDPAEALAFGDRIVVLENGRASQSGDRNDLLRYPRSPYVAEFLGLNLFRGTVTARADGVAQVACDGGTLAVADGGTDGEVLIVVAPQEIVLARERPGGSALNVFAGRIEELTPEPPQGERLRVRIASRPPIVAEVTRASAEAMGLAPGETVHASFKATGARVFR